MSIIYTYLKNVLIFSCFIYISGCANFGTPHEVSIPVQVPCISAGDIPKKQASLFEASKGQSLFEQIKALLIDRENSIIYETELETELAGCK